MIRELSIIIAMCINAGPQTDKTLEIQPIGPDSVRFRIEVEQQNCTGEVEGIATRIGPNRFRWHASPGCTEIIINIGPVGITVEETGPCFDLHGLYCNFAGAYKSTDTKKTNENLSN
jgi:hypothetical protein